MVFDRLTKDEAQIALRPLRHWADSEIRCHIFTGIAAMMFLRIIELKLRKAGVGYDSKAAMRLMVSLRFCLLWLPGKRKTMRMLEDSDENQAEIVRAFG